MFLLLCALQLTSPVPPASSADVAPSPLSSPAPFRSVGFEWHGDLSSIEVSILASDGTPGPWWPVVQSHDLSDAASGGRRLSALVHGTDPASIGILLRGRRDIPLQVHWISVAAPPAAVNRPPVFSRASWGANQPNCNPTYCSTSHVAMHHTASASEYTSTSWSQCAANVKATQVYHMATRGWCDIGYNYLICPHGDIFEGRAGGDDVRGAHDGYNCGSMGVAMMGYFHPPYSQTLTGAMQASFVDLAGWKCDQQGIDPLGSSWYAGLGAVEQNIYGHRDVSSTACPGDLAYAELPQLRVRVDNLLNGGGTTLILDNGVASFQGSWTTSSSASGHYGPDYRWASTGTAPARAMWTPQVPSPGLYQVSMWWPAGSNRNPATVVGVSLQGSLHTATVDQQSNGGQWNVLGNVRLPAGAVTTFGLSNAGNPGWVVVADALRLVKL
jgi:hypothetical protein